MGIVNYSSPRQILTDISNILASGEYSHSEIHGLISNGSTTGATNGATDGAYSDIVLYQLFWYAWINIVIYLQSRIDLKDLQKTITLISYKTSNDQKVCESLEYWKFNNLAIALNEIMEEEAKSQSSDGAETPNSNSMMSDARRSMSSMMSGMKSPGKMPSMPKLR